MTTPTRIAYLVSHPIQYQAPLLRAIAAEPDIALTVFFCSDVSVGAHRDEGFARVIDWDVTLTDGYDHQLLPAIGRTDRMDLLHPLTYGLGRALRDGGFEVLWVHGYARPYHLLAMTAARARGLIVLNRDEAWSKSARRGPLKRRLKRAFYGALRRVCHGFLVIGSANRAYYLENGMEEETLFDMPYAVDNASFRARAEAAAGSREALRAELGLAEGRSVILFAAKFATHKRPGDLLEAWARIADDEALGRPCLVFVGDGAEDGALRRRAAEIGRDGVVFAGFRNQSELPRFYDLCDVFVLPSAAEPWGLVINEAMCAGRAVIASDRVGAAADLLRDGENGAVFPAGDVDALAEALRRVLGDAERCRRMGARALEIVEGWSFDRDIEGLRAALDALVPARGGCAR